MARTELQLKKRLDEQRAIRSGLPSMDQYYPVLSGPSRQSVRLQLRGTPEARSFINFSSSNYLSINARPEVKEAFVDAVDRYGSGANGSPVLSGYYEPHRTLESRLSKFHGTEDTVLFSSGYCANLSVVSACLGPNDLLLFDEAIHGSIIDGGKLAQTRMRSFRHNDPEDLRASLKRLRPMAEVTMVATLGVYSMSGTMAPLPEIVAAAHDYDALVMLDEAHSVGVLGESGRGAVEHFGLNPRDVDITVGTLSKTLAGVGGYVCGSASLTELLRFAARPHVLSAAIPPPSAAACGAAVAILEVEGAALSARLRNRADYFRKRLREHGIELLGEGTGVAAFSEPDFQVLWQASQELFDKGVFFNPVLYPAVRRDEGRMRYYLNSEHSLEDLAKAADLTRAALDHAGRRSKS